MLVRLLVLLVTVILLVGVVRSGTGTDVAGAAGLASLAANGDPADGDDADAGGEIQAPAPAPGFDLPAARELRALPTPLVDGRLHAVRLFRPPRPASSDPYVLV